MTFKSVFNNLLLAKLFAATLEGAALAAAPFQILSLSAGTFRSFQILKIDSATFVLPVPGGP